MASAQVLQLVEGYVALAEKLFKAKSYEDAVDSLRKAEAALDDADIPADDAREYYEAVYHHLARAYDQMGQPMAAYGYYTKFVGVADGRRGAAAEAVRRAEDARARLLAVLDKTALRFEVEPDGTEVRLDQRVVGRSPLPPVKVGPGPHQVTFSAEGYQPAHVDVDVAAGATAPVVVKLVPTSAASAGPARPGDGPAPPPEAGPQVLPPPRPDAVDDVDALVDGELGRPTPGRHWGLVAALGAAALASGAAAGYFFWQAGEADDRGASLEADVETRRLNDEYPNKDAYDSALHPAQGEYDDATRARNVAVGLSVLAVGAAGAAGYFLLAAPSANAAAADGPRMVVLPHRLLLDWRF